MAKRDRNRFRKTYPYLRRKPVFETVMTAGSNVDMIQVGVISYNETHTGSHTFATAFTKVPTITALVVENDIGTSSASSGNINAFVTAVSLTSVTIEVSDSNFVGNVHFHAISEI